MRWEADVKIAGPVGSMGQRVLQPIVNQQVKNVLDALDKQVTQAAASGASAGHERGGGGDQSAERGGLLGRPARADPDGLTVPPFRIGVMQLTMEPLDEMLESARVMDRAGMDTIWLAEAYPWWRKHGMEARSSTVVSALMARETERLTIGWGIISPFTRHPVQVAMDARVVQEAAGPGRFLLGFGTSKIFLNNTRQSTKKTLGPMRDAVAIVRGVLGGERVRVRGRHVERVGARAAGRGRDAARGAARLRRGDGAEDAGARGRDRRRLPDAVDHDAGVRPLHARERRRGHRHRLHGRRLDPRVGSRGGARRRARDRRHVPREQGAEHPRRGRHAARARRDRSGGDPAGRRGDGARRAARGEGGGDATRSSTAASRSRARRRTASRRSRSTATPAARTSCSSSGARTGTGRSSSSGRKCCRTFASGMGDGHGSRAGCRWPVGPDEA